MNFLVIMDLQTLAVETITAVRFTFPQVQSWSPDGSQILSTCFTARDSFLCVMNRMGDSHLLLEDQYRMVTSPIWSSDGRQIVFVNSGDLYMTNPDGSDVRRLAYGDGEYASPAWRP